MMQLKIDAKNILGECILWCERLQRLLWTDIEGACLWCYYLASDEILQWAMPERLACFALTDDDDRLLLGLASRIAYFQFSTQLITPICDVESDLLTTRINDGRCDRQGRFVFGCFNQASDAAAIGSFYRLNADLTLERLPLPKAAVANSICFSLDGTTMYYCNSPDKVIRYCSYDASSGAISDDRLFANLSGQPGEPDGSTIDAEGYLWNAQWGGRRVVRYAPDGQIDRVLDLPVSQPSCVTFGGLALTALYVSTARISLSDTELALQPQAGGIFHAELYDARGIPEQRFLGRRF